MSHFVPDQEDPRILTTSDVVRASFVAVYPGRFPVRVVLRKAHEGSVNNEYVVYTETLEMSRRPEDETKSIALVHRSFEQGDYFTDEARARARFEERAAKL